MKSIGTFKAKTHLSELLEHVQHGETYIITKRGKPVATILPFSEEKPSETKRRYRSRIRAFRNRFKEQISPISLDEIRDYRAEGRR